MALRISDIIAQTSASFAPKTAIWSLSGFAAKKDTKGDYQRAEKLS